MKLSVAYNDSTQTTSPAEFAIDANSLITIGREPGQSIVFTTTGVSRYHARILPDPASSLYLQIEDVGSTNGTFVNGTKISGPTRLEPGSRIRLGQTGPEFTIDTDPRPPMGTTADLSGTSVDSIPVMTAPPGPAVGPAITTPPHRQTVQTRAPQKSSPALAIVAGVFAIAAIGVLGYWGYTQMKGHGPTSSTGGTTSGTTGGTTSGGNTVNKDGVAGSAQAIYKANAGAVVRLDVNSELVAARSQVPVYIVNRYGRQVYRELRDGKIVPKLTQEPANNTPLTIRVQGTGFIFRPTGFALTCRHVVNPWKSSVTFPASRGAYLERYDGTTVTRDIDEADLTIEDLTDKFDLDGKILKMTATVGDKVYGVDAGSVSYSREDVAQFRINAPDNLPTVDLDETGTEMGVGAEIVVLGFSSNVNPTHATQIAKSGTGDVTTDDTTKVSLGDGKIGNVGEANKLNSSGTSGSKYGDMYQLTVNTLGPGASGGPVFDQKRGKVVGVLAMSQGVANSAVMFAVPIKYGLKLFGDK